MTRDAAVVSNAPRVLIVEDDPEVLALLERALADRGFVPEIVTSGEAALERIRAEEPDVVILDLGLPGGDGLETASRVRALGIDVPILILTGRGAVRDRVSGLDSGADDYVGKPFDVDELSARLRALLRRARPRQAPLECGGLTIRRDARELRYGDRHIALSSRELALLEYFVRHADQPVSRYSIAATVWADASLRSDGTNVIDVYVAYLRRKLEAVGAPPLLQTVRGVGYLFRQPAEKP